MASKRSVIRAFIEKGGWKTWPDTRGFKKGDLFAVSQPTGQWTIPVLVVKDTPEHREMLGVPLDIDAEEYE